MGIQDRDYYRDKLREAEGYVEASRARAPRRQRAPLDPAWSRFWRTVAFWIVAGGLVMLAVRYFMHR